MPHGKGLVILCQSPQFGRDCRYYQEFARIWHPTKSLLIILWYGEDVRVLKAMLKLSGPDDATVKDLRDSVVTLDNSMQGWCAAHGLYC